MEKTYKTIVWTCFVASIVFVAYQYYASYDTVAALRRKREGTQLNAPVGAPKDFTWRDNSGNTNMRGKFTPSKPGSRSGTMELRDSNGNRIGTINVRD